MLLINKVAEVIVMKMELYMYMVDGRWGSMKQELFSKKQENWGPKGVYHLLRSIQYNDQEKSVTEN